MRKIATILFLSQTCLLQAQSWQQVPAFPGSARDDGASFVIGQKAWCGTGLQTGWIAAVDFSVFDMQTETWAPAPAMPLGNERQYACGFSNGTLGFIFGGLDAGGNYENDLWAFDPATGNWQQKTALPGNGRSGAACFVIDSIAYIIGGQTINSIASNEVWAYNMNTDTWQTKNNFLAEGTWRSAATNCNDTGYLIFGKDSAGIFSNRLLRYNQANDSWSIIAVFPGTGRTYSSMQSINSKLVVFAGVDSTQVVYNDLWTFDVVSLQWQQQPVLPSFGRKGGMSFTNGLNFYYTTGIDQQNNRLSETWKSDDPTGVTAFTAASGIVLFPNPANSFVQLKSDPELFKSSTIQLLNLQGAVLGEEIPLAETCLVNVNDLPAGIYFLRIKTGTNTVVRKFAVTHPD